MECSKYQAAAEEAIAKLLEKEKDLLSAEKKIIYYENQVSDQQTRLGQAEDEAKLLRNENAKLNMQLEKETLARAHLEAKFSLNQQQLSQNHKTLEEQVKINREEIAKRTKEEEKEEEKRNKIRMKRKEERERKRERKWRERERKRRRREEGEGEGEGKGEGKGGGEAAE